MLENLPLFLAAAGVGAGLLASAWTLRQERRRGRTYQAALALAGALNRNPTGFTDLGLRDVLERFGYGDVDPKAVARLLTDQGVVQARHDRIIGGPIYRPRGTQR